MNKVKELVFLCGSRDFHAIDWYRSAQEQIPAGKLSLLTDLIQSEGYTKLIHEDDVVHKLLIIDVFLFKSQTNLGNLWRNIIKLLLLPLQIFLLKRFYKKKNEVVFHAHGMYYIWLAAAANVPFIGTPQGSEILLRPFRSRIYRFFSLKSLKKALFITVDSVKMKEKCYEISSVTPKIIQNGIDLKSIDIFLQNKNKTVINKNKIVSQRGMTSLYRIEDIITSRDQVKGYFPISFIYPFYENDYRHKVLKKTKKGDENLGRVSRVEMYELFSQSKLVLSIPSSDSSPRSVYEAIFCGAIVGITYHPYFDFLPKDMKNRIFLIDLEDENWFIKAISYSEKICNEEFIPSEEALNIFDQRKSFTKILNLIKD